MFVEKMLLIINIGCYVLHGGRYCTCTDSKYVNDTTGFMMSKLLELQC